MPPQIKRLLPLFVIFIGLFLLARYFLIPESFGKYGFYRGFSLEENAAKKVNYAGKEYCVECHDDVQAEKSQDAHMDLSCEVCHGPGQDHADNPDSVEVSKPSGRVHCLLCHSRNPAKNQNVIVQIDVSGHYINKDCIECHNPHKPWDLKNQDTPGENF
jgi:hypothetical protein